MSIKTLSFVFCSLSPKTWLIIQVQRFCRLVCMCFFPLETFCYFEKCFMHVSPLELLAHFSSFPYLSHLSEHVYIAAVSFQHYKMSSCYLLDFRESKWKWQIEKLRLRIASLLSNTFEPLILFLHLPHCAGLSPLPTPLYPASCRGWEGKGHPVWTAPTGSLALWLLAGIG